MFPGKVNPKKMKQMMKQMGMEMTQVPDVEKVLIQTAGGNYVFDSADVVIMTIQGVATYQITGEPRFEEGEREIPAEDVTLVASQAGVSEDAAREALIETHGDIAGAIMKLSGND